MKIAGWIKLHRKLKDNALWTAEPFTKGQAWVDLIMMAQFKDKKLMVGNKIVLVQRGSFVTSEVKLSERWRWSRGKVRGFLTTLVNNDMIAKNKTGNYTTLTIVNYGFYQDEQPEERHLFEQPVDTLLNSELTAERQPIDSHLYTKEERKKEKKVKEREERKNNPPISPRYFPDDEKLDSAFADFVDFRRRAGAPLNDINCEKVKRKVLEMSMNADGDFSYEKAAEILEQSVINGWKGIFPLKQDKKRASPQQEDDWESLRQELREESE